VALSCALASGRACVCLCARAWACVWRLRWVVGTRRWQGLPHRSALSHACRMRSWLHDVAVGRSAAQCPETPATGHRPPLGLLASALGPIPTWAHSHLAAALCSGMSAAGHRPHSGRWRRWGSFSIAGHDGLGALHSAAAAHWHSGRASYPPECCSITDGSAARTLEEGARASCLLNRGSSFKQKKLVS